MVLKKRDSVGQYDQFKYNFYLIKMKKNKCINWTSNRMEINSASSHVYSVLWLLAEAVWLKFPYRLIELMSVSSYILRGKESSTHWIHGYCKCVLGMDLCSFVKSIGHSPSAFLRWICLIVLHFISFLLHLYPFVLSTAFGKVHVTSLFLLRDLIAL